MLGFMHLACSVSQSTLQETGIHAANLQVNEGGRHESMDSAVFYFQDYSGQE